MLKPLLKKILTLWIFFGYWCACQATIFYPTILFVLYEAGETQSLLQVMKLLGQEQTDYAIISFGTSSKILKDNKHVINIHKACRFKTHIDYKHWESPQRISENDVSKLTRCIDPAVVIVGMASMAQSQIAQAFSLKDRRKIIGYYDSFKSARNNAVAKSVAQFSDLVIVADSNLMDAFEKLPGRRVVKTMGNPSIGLWHDAIKQNRELNTVVALHESVKKKPVILYVGGYGEEYVRSFEIFVQSLSEMTDKEIIISLHPKVDGTTEQAILAMHNVTNYKFLPRDTTTLQAALKADYVVCHRSTAGIQAFMANIPVIYLDVHPEGYTNSLIAKKIVPQISCKEDLLKILNDVKPYSYSPEQLENLIGIPMNAAIQISAAIKSAIPNSIGRPGPVYR